MPLGRSITPGLVFTIDLSKITDRENPRTVEAPIAGNTSGLPFTVDWGDGTTTDYPAGASTFPSHEYAAVGVYTVTIRSANGNLPKIAFSAYNSTRNIVPALISVDHHGGESYNASQQFNYSIALAENCTYVDARYPGQSGWTNFANGFRSSGISQPLESFCFDFATQASAFTATFIYCNKLSGSIPDGLFDNNTMVTNFASCFEGCVNITGSIPEGLFDNNTLVSNFASTFRNCQGLTDSIPADLFKYNTSVTTFSGCFRSCSGLTGSIPADLFKYNTSITDASYIFNACSQLTGIPQGLFDNNTGITTIVGLFGGCDGLTSIPSDLFDNCTALTDCRDAFRYARNISSAPYKFWDEYGATKSTFPNLTQTGGCYTYCNSMDLTQVPSAYGGSWSV